MDNKTTIEKQIINSIFSDNRIIDELTKVGITDRNFTDKDSKILFKEIKKRREEEKKISRNQIFLHCKVSFKSFADSDYKCGVHYTVEEIPEVIEILSETAATTEEDINKFFEGQKFIHKRLSDEIMKKYKFRYCFSEFYAYDNGVYIPGGEKVIEKECELTLGEKVNNHRVKEIKGSIRRSSYSDEPVLSKELINVKNGRLNWKTGELFPHNPDNFNITQLPVEYDPKAKCPNFDDYLLSTLDVDVIYLLQEIMGYCLIPDTSFEKAIMLIGGGANGKGVFLDVLSYLLGQENVEGAELQELADNRFRAAELLGKLANISADIGSHSLENSGRFKMLVTGDILQVERKHQQPFKFRNYARMLFSCNEIPRSKDKTYAFYRRWLIIPFNKTFKGKKADKNLRDKLKKELPGIFNYAVEGLKRLKENNEFTQPKQIEKAMEEYKKQNDSVTAFVIDKIQVNKGGVIPKQHLYDNYKDWCEEQGLMPVSHKNPSYKKALTDNIKELDEVRTKGGAGPWAWINIQII